jgi:hypothetical protein
MVNVMWKTVTTHPIYEVSDAGEVRNTATNKVLKPGMDNRGYQRVVLGPGSKTISVHRLVALYHIENPENKLEVDHIDRNRSNNSVQNLQWATRSENQLNRGYAIKNPEMHHMVITKYGSFQVKIRGRTKVDKCFKTLEDAIAFRDRFMEENPR